MDRNEATRTCARGTTAGLALVLALAGCTKSSDPPNEPDASEVVRTSMDQPEADPIGESSVPASEAVEPGPIDGTVTLGPGRGCELDTDAPITPGRLALKLVNDSRFEGGFRVTRLSPDQTLVRLRERPPAFLFGPRSTVFLDPSTARRWSSARSITSARWAVVCYRDRIPAPNGFMILAVGVAGLIEVGR
jgi:hypothetical protein